MKKTIASYQWFAFAWSFAGLCVYVAFGWSGKPIPEDLSQWLLGSGAVTSGSGVLLKLLTDRRNGTPPGAPVGMVPGNEESN